MVAELRTELGKIQRVRVGFGGYQDAQFGVWWVLGGDGWGVQDGDGCWVTEITAGTKWTEDGRSEQLAKIMRDLMTKCREAKVENVDALADKPIEVEFDGNLLKSWRILTEVL